MKNFANHAVSRRAFLGGSAAAAALGLAACGGNSGSDAKTDAGTTTGGKEGGGTLTVGSAYSPSSYDPANCSSAFCFSANMNVMEGIYTTCVVPDTLDESPMAYKSMDEIVAQIGPTAEIIERIRPVYNFKAAD